MGETYRPNPEAFHIPEPEAEQQETQQQSEKTNAVMRKLKRWALYGITATSLGYGMYKGIEQNVERYYEQYPEDDQHGDVERELRDDLQFVVGGNIKDVAYGDIRAREQHDSSRAEPEFHGYELLGLTEQDLRGLFQDGKFLPKNYINGEVRHFSVNAKGTKFYSRGGALMAMELGNASPASEEIRITFPQGFHTNKKEIRNYLDSVFAVGAHEVAHLNDWETDADLSLAERYQLLQRVLKRLQSTDFVHGVGAELFEGKNARGYVDNVGDPDPQIEKYSKAREYWAEIVKYTILFPDWMKTEHPQDFSLVEEYVHKNDPTFDPFQAEKERNQYLDETYGSGSRNLIEAEILQRKVDSNEQAQHAFEASLRKNHIPPRPEQATH